MANTTYMTPIIGLIENYRLREERKQAREDALALQEQRLAMEQQRIDIAERDSQSAAEYRAKQLAIAERDSQMRKAEYDRNVANIAKMREARRNLNQNTIGQVQQELSDVGQEVIIAADKVQKLRKPDSKNKPVGGIDFRDGEDGRIYVGFNREDGEFINYNANPTDDNSPKLWIDPNEIGALEQHYNSLTKELGQVAPDVSKEKLFNAAFSADSDGKVRAATVDEFLAKVKALQPADTSSGASESKQSDSKATIDAKNSKEVGARDFGTIFDEDGVVGLGLEQLKIGKYAASELGSFLVDNVGKPVKRFLVGKPVENKNKTIKVTPQKNGVLKPKIRGRKFDFNKDFKALTKIREFNQQVEIAEKELKAKQDKLMRTANKIPRLQALGELYALGDPSVNADMLKNVYETGDENTSLDDLRKMAVEQDKTISQLKKDRSIIVKNFAQAQKALADANGSGKPREQEKFEFFRKTIEPLVEDRANMFFGKKDDQKRKALAQKVSTNLAVYLDVVGMAPEELATYKGSTILTQAISFLANKGDSDFSNTSIAPAFAAAIGGIKPDKYGEFQDLYAMAINQGAKSGRSENNILNALKVYVDQGGDAEEFLTDIAAGML